MKFYGTPISGLQVIETAPFKDARGTFERLYCENELKSINVTKRIVQINHSVSKKKGSVRGLHFQHQPYAEIKIIRCLRGSVFDVSVDIRRDSPTFLRWHAEKLTGGNCRTICIPEGVAHGFQSLEDDSELLYLHTNFYSKDHEAGLRYNDPMLNISWPLPITEVSERDRNHPLLDKGFLGIIL